MGLDNPTKALYGLDNDEKQTVKLSLTNGKGNPSRVLVNEPGLYGLILRSNKPEAKAFKRWVTYEVLPFSFTERLYNTVTKFSVVRYSLVWIKKF